MEKLNRLVKDLENKYNKEEQIKILQQINALLLTDYELRIGDDVVHPLRVEAYYWPYKTKCKFEDDSTFPSKDKLGKLGKLYFIEPKYGYPGIDICLSDGDYYLSFLVKNSYIGDKTYKQMDLYEKYKDIREKLEDTVVLSAMSHKNEIVFNTSRVRASNKDFAHDLLASVIEINRKNNGKSIYDWEKNYGKQWTIARYALSNMSDEISAKELARKLNGSEIEDKYWKTAKESLEYNS